MKTSLVNYIFFISITLVLLFICEGGFSVGYMWNFSHYTPAMWILQVLITTGGVCTGIKWAEN